MAGTYAKYGITVNAIGPGLFPTEMTEDLLAMHGFKDAFGEKNPTGRPGKEDELNGTVLFLSSDASRYVQGQFPIMFGAAGPNAVIQVIPWVITAHPMIIITVVLMYRSGDVVGATCNAVLSVVLMGQNFVKGIMNLVYFVSGKEVPAEFVRDAARIDGCAYLVGVVYANIYRMAGIWRMQNCRVLYMGVGSWFFGTFHHVFDGSAGRRLDWRNWTWHFGNLAYIYRNRRCCE